MTGRKDFTQLLPAAAERSRQSRLDMGRLAAEAKAAGMPVREIAELLGYKERRSVYQLIEAAELADRG